MEGSSFRGWNANPEIQLFEANYLSLLLCDRSFVLSATRVRLLLSSSQAMLFATKKETTIMAAMPARSEQQRENPQGKVRNLKSQRIRSKEGGMGPTNPGAAAQLVAAALWLASILTKVVPQAHFIPQKQHAAMPATASFGHISLFR
jgi:hypothetical protein